MPNIALRVDADCKSFWRMRRSLALAHALHETDPGSEIILLTTGSYNGLDSIGFKIIDVGFGGTDIERAIDEHSIEMLVLDMNSVQDSRALREKVGMLAILDDYSNQGSYSAHILVNPNLNVHLLEYDCDADTEILLGTDFFPLGPEYDPLQDSKRDNPEKVRRIVVYFGEEDSAGDMLKAVYALKGIKENFIAALLVGKSFSHGEELAREIGLDQRFMVIPESMNAHRVSGSDLAIIDPQGLNEVAFLKLPSALICRSPEQEALVDYAGKNGLAVPLGRTRGFDVASASKALERLLTDKRERDRISLRLDELVDGLGRYRLADILLSRLRTEEQPI